MKKAAVRLLFSNEVRLRCTKNEVCLLYTSIGADMPVIAVVFDTKQSFIGWLCIGQYITGCGAVHKTLCLLYTSRCV